MTPTDQVLNDCVAAVSFNKLLFTSQFLLVAPLVLLHLKGAGKRKSGEAKSSEVKSGQVT